MRFLSRGLAAVLSLAVAAQPVLSAEVRSAFSASASRGAAVSVPALPTLPSPALLPAANVTLPLYGASERFPQASVRAAVAASPLAAASKHIVAAAAQAAKASVDQGRASGDQSSVSAQRQFNALTGEADDIRASGPGDGAAPASVPDSGSTRLAPSSPQPPPHAPQPPKKSRLWNVFPNDPARRQSFWRYLGGYSIFSLVYEMYLVSFPFLIASMTRNSLRAHNDPRLNDPKAVEALINRNRAEGRIFHWTGQSASYASMPLFSGKGEQAPQPWLTRSTLIRAGFLAGVAAVALFATGHVPLGAAVLFVSLSMGAASFFQGVAGTKESLGTFTLMGADSVSETDRDKANAILNIVSNFAAIIGPALAGHLSMSVSNLFGQTDVSSYIVYFIYAVGTALSGLVYFGVRLFWQRASNKLAPTTGPPFSLKGALGQIGSSLRTGIKLLWSNKFLRYTVIGIIINSLFSDPLSSSILPDYVATLTKGIPGIAALLKVPVLGWLLQGLTGSPMGFYSFMIVSYNVSSMVASFLLEPVRKVLAKFGATTAESALKPLYVLAFLEPFLFKAMLHWHSLPLVLAFYGLQSLVTGFGALVAQGLMQKAVNEFPEKDRISVLASESFVGTITAIVSMVIYGFALNKIPVGAMMSLALMAVGLQAGIRLAIPWLSFKKSAPKPPAKP